MNEQRTTANARTFPNLWGLISQIFLVVIFISLAVSNWHESGSAEPISPTLSIVLIGLLVLILLGSMLIQRYVQGKSWAAVLSWSADLNPRDEREWQLFAKASQYTFGANYLLLLVVAVIFLLAPPTGPFGTLYTFLAIFELQLSIRALIAWALGLR